MSLMRPQPGDQVRIIYKSIQNITSYICCSRLCLSDVCDQIPQLSRDGMPFYLALVPRSSIDSLPYKVSYGLHRNSFTPICGH